MFQNDKLILSKPRDVKTLANSFVNTIDKFEKSQTNKNVPSSFLREKQKAQESIKGSNLSVIRTNLSKGNLKLESVKPVARNFLEQVSKIDMSEKLKLIFNYSDSKGKEGYLAENGGAIKIAINKILKKNYEEDEILIYSLKEFEVVANGIFIQVKGWGNSRELCVVNALKNSLKKLPLDEELEPNEKIIFSYSLSSIASMGENEYECKLKVIPGKILTTL